MIATSRHVASYRAHVAARLRASDVGDAAIALNGLPTLHLVIGSPPCCRFERPPNANAMAALMNPIKGARNAQPAAASAEALDLQQMAVAHYANTDHDTQAGRLIQGQVDHTLMIGKRVHTTPEALAEMEAEFRRTEEFRTTLFQLGTCPVCQRGVTHGEFGVDHLMYYLEGDEERVPRKIRSLPRIWCGPCAKKRAKQQRRPHVKSRDDVPFADEWKAFVKQIRREQGQDVDGEPEPEPVAEPANAPTRRLWDWLAKALVAAAPATEAKIAFRVTGVAPTPGSDLDLENKKFSIRLKVTYEASTKLVSGETVDAVGASVVALALETGAAAATVAAEAGGTARLVGEPDAEVLERCMLKTDLIAKVWAKKGVQKLVLAKLADLRATALALLEEGTS